MKRVVRVLLVVCLIGFNPFFACDPWIQGCGEVRTFSIEELFLIPNYDIGENDILPISIASWEITTRSYAYFPDSERIWWIHPFISSSMACSPGLPYSKEKITDISVSTKTDLKMEIGTLPGGASINDFVLVNGQSLDDFKKQIPFNLDEYTDFWLELDLLLAEPTFLDFEVIVTLDDGRSFYLRPDPVWVN